MSKAPVSPARLAAYIAVPAALLAGGITAYTVASHTSAAAPSSSAAVNTAPITASTLDVPGAATPDCTKLLNALPPKLGGNPERQVIGLDSARAWGSTPTVLVCGTTVPADFEPTSTVSGVNGVSWFTETAFDTTPYGLPGENSVWTVVDRTVYISVAVPDSLQPAVVISPLSTIIAATVPPA